MRKQRIFAALTAAATALSSAAAFPSAAFAAEKQVAHSFDPAFSDTVEMRDDMNMETDQFTLNIIDDLDLVNAIKEKTGDDFLEYSQRITKASITYTVTGEGEDISVYAACVGQTAGGEWVDEVTEDNLVWYEGKSGIISTDDVQIAALGLESYTFIGIAARGKGAGDLTLNVTGVELEVSYDVSENIPVTGTETYAFPDVYLSNDIDKHSVFTVGYEPFEEDYFVGDWIWDNPESLTDISTVEDFVSRYGSFEMKFKAEDIQGDAEVYALLETGDESKGKYQQIALPAQDVTEGKNVYSVNFDGNIKSAYEDFQSISVHFRSKTEGTTAKFTMGLYNSETIAATGTETFKNDIELEEDCTVSVEMPEWWDPEWGPLYWGEFGLWYFGNGEEPNTCPKDTVTELYGTYKGGEISFNVKGLSTDVTYQVVLMTRDGDNFGENIVISDNNTLRNGANTVKFDLPKITYNYPEIWGLGLRFDADKATEFTICKPEASTPATPSTPSTPSIPSAPSTSEPSASEPASPDTNEVFKTEDKPIEDIMEEVKPDTTASIEVAPADTTIKADVFEAAKEKKVTLELKLENGVKWEIKAETIGDGAADVNINVELNTSNVPAASVDAVAEGKSTMQISLAHNGSFGFEANITIPVASANNGKVANLFHFSNGALEFVASVTVSEGEAKLPFSHASEYVIVFDEKSMGASESTSAPETNNNPGTGAAGVGGFAALAAVSAAAVIICRKNKHD